MFSLLAVGLLIAVITLLRFRGGGWVVLVVGALVVLVYYKLFDAFGLIGVPWTFQTVFAMTILTILFAPLIGGIAAILFGISFIGFSGKQIAKSRQRAHERQEHIRDRQEHFQQWVEEWVFERKFPPHGPVFVNRK